MGCTYRPIGTYLRRGVLSAHVETPNDMERLNLGAAVVFVHLTDKEAASLFTLEKMHLLVAQAPLALFFSDTDAARTFDFACRSLATPQADLLVMTNYSSGPLSEALEDRNYNDVPPTVPATSLHTIPSRTLVGEPGGGNYPCARPHHPRH
jgi:hypothetical protein